MTNNNILPCSGIRLGLFTPDQAFDVVAKKQIEKLRKPCLTLIQLVSTELYSIANGAVTKVECPVLCIFLSKGVEALFSVHMHSYIYFVCVYFFIIIFCLICAPCLFCFQFVFK